MGKEEREELRTDKDGEKLTGTTYLNVALRFPRELYKDLEGEELKITTYLNVALIFHREWRTEKNSEKPKRATKPNLALTGNFRHIGTGKKPKRPSVPT